MKVVKLVKPDAFKADSTRPGYRHRLLCYSQETVRVLRLDDLLLDPMVAQSWALPLVQDVKLIKSLGMQSASTKSWNGAMQIYVFFFNCALSWFKD